MAEFSGEQASIGLKVKKFIDGIRFGKEEIEHYHMFMGKKYFSPYLSFLGRTGRGVF